jgi:hypothetical protein
MTDTQKPSLLFKNHMRIRKQPTFSQNQHPTQIPRISLRAQPLKQYAPQHPTKYTTDSRPMITMRIPVHPCFTSAYNRLTTHDFNKNPSPCPYLIFSLASNKIQMCAPTIFSCIEKTKSSLLYHNLFPRNLRRSSQYQTIIVNDAYFSSCNHKIIMYESDISSYATKRSLQNQ